MFVSRMQTTFISRGEGCQVPRYPTARYPPRAVVMSRLFPEEMPGGRAVQPSGVAPTRHLRRLDEDHLFGFRVRLVDWKKRTHQRLSEDRAGF